jgi:hypothetical protein
MRKCRGRQGQSIDTTHDPPLKWLDKTFNLIYSSSRQGPEGNALMHEMGLRTESLDPPHNYVPWVVVDGVHNTTIQNMAMADLTALVCQTYQVYIGS